VWLGRLLPPPPYPSLRPGRCSVPQLQPWRQVPETESAAVQEAFTFAGCYCDEVACSEPEQVRNILSMSGSCRDLAGCSCPIPRISISISTQIAHGTFEAPVSVDGAIESSCTVILCP
jgi:hypothetical protein